MTLPSILILEMKGLRFVAIVGAGLNATGAILKCAGISRTRWWIVFAGQAIGKCLQIVKEGIRFVIFLRLKKY